MKVSKLIKRLTEALEKYGDKDVIGYFDVETAEFFYGGIPDKAIGPEPMTQALAIEIKGELAPPIIE